MQILLVDDEENILRSLNRLLIDEDFVALTAGSGEEGLKILKEYPDIGLILSGQRMPGMTGVDFLEKAKGIAPDALKIVLTGHMDINAVIDAINRGGAHRYITKPWNDDEILLILRDGVEKYNLFKENKYLTDLTRRAGLDDSMVDIVTTAAQLHDIGKIGIYPIGSLVLLNTGELGIVYKPHPDPEWEDRPQVILVERDGKGDVRKKVIDLTEADERGHFKESIVKTLDPYKSHIDIAKYFL